MQMEKAPSRGPFFYKESRSFAFASISAAALQHMAGIDSARYFLRVRSPPVESEGDVSGNVGGFVLNPCRLNGGIRPEDDHFLCILEQPLDFHLLRGSDL